MEKNGRAQMWLVMLEGYRRDAREGSRVVRSPVWTGLCRAWKRALSGRRKARLMSRVGGGLSHVALKGTDSKFPCGFQHCWVLT